MKNMRKLCALLLVAITMTTVLPSCTKTDGTRTEDTTPAEDNNSNDASDNNNNG